LAAGVLMDKILELEKRIELLEKALDEILNKPVVSEQQKRAITKNIFCIVGGRDD